MRKSWKVLVVVALAGSSLTVLPVQAASAQSAGDPSANGTVVADGGALPDEPRATPPDLTDRTDTDGDGVTDAEETAGTRNPWPGGFIGMAAPGDPTDPADPDSDDDGLSDGLEIGTDGGNRAGTGTDPNDADTDDDGVDDTTEVASGTDARSADTDLDEVDDGVEAELGTDPDVADSDFDGAPDGAERAAGTDPLVSSVTGVEAAGPFHFTDVPAGAYYEDAAYWATSDEVGALKRSPQFVPNGEVKRWKLAQILRNYATYLGRDTTAPPHSFNDIGALRRRARAAVSWATSNGIIPPTSPSTFTPGRTITRAQLATALYRFARWAGDDASATPGDDPYADTTTLNDTTRSAIGWLSLTGSLVDSGVVTSPTSFKPKKLVTRAAAVSLLFQLDEEVGTPQPTEDADGDGLSNFDEVQGIQNPYPEPTDGGDVDPLDPAGQCLSPEPVTDLPPTADGPGAPTDPDDPDSDDDGMSDGKETSELQSDPNDADTDNDCVSDGDEVDGYPLVLDLDGQGCPGGGGGGCPDITRYTSHSDPLDEDTDDDELPDHEEVLLRTDPELADTDIDGLDDYQEWNRWFTAPTTVDSDRDSRGGEGDQPPTPSLFDGLELRDTGTSPTLADTDGDGTTDFDEFDSPIRNMTVAELPGFSMDLVGGTSVRLIKERSQDQGGAIEVGVTDSVSNSTSTSSSSSVTQSESNAISVELGFELSVEIGTETTETQTYSVNFGYSHEWGTERTREWSKEESQEIAQERSRTQSEEWSSSEAAVGGVISQGMRFTNTGKFTYELSNVGYTLFLRNPETQEEQAVGTMTIPLEGIVLAPGASTEPIQAVAEDLDVDLIEQFLASPSSLRFSTGNIEFLDSEGRNLEFVQESTFGQTAQVVLDFGAVAPGEEGRYEEYNVSTNVARDDIGGDFNDISLYPGVHMGSPPADSPAWMSGVMDQIGYSRCEDDTPAAGCYTVTPDGAIASIDGVANTTAADAGPNECVSVWTVQTSTDDQTEQSRTDGFEAVVVHAGDRMRLVRQTDCDKDGMIDSVEPLVNAQDDLPDTDGDGLSDLDEAEGWIVALADPAAGGQPCAPDPGAGAPLWASDSEACPWAAPNPKIADTDGDGVGDRQELDGAGRNVSGSPIDARANPLEQDSDGDLFSDCLALGDTGCSGRPPDPAPLNSSVRYVDPTPCATAGCWPNPLPDLNSALAITGVNANADPRDDVRSVWVAGGTYLAPTTGFQLPGEAGVFGGFRGDEQRLDERTLAFTGPTATRLVGQAVGQTGPVVDVPSDFSTLDGVVVQGGTRGGISGTGGHATLRDLEVSNNSRPAWVAPATPAAAGISWSGGDSLLVRRATVASNNGPIGGVSLNGLDDAHIEQSVIRNNLSDRSLLSRNCTTSPAFDCSGGGGVGLEDAEVAIDDSAVEDNTGLVGGGIDADGAGTTLRLRNTSVTGNTAQGDSVVVGRGGGVHAHGSAAVLLAGCLLADNVTRVGPRWPANPAADGFGGGLFAHDDANVRMINCTVTGNNGAGVIVAGDENSNYKINSGYDSASTGFVNGASATFQSSVFVGNTMYWQPTRIDRDDHGLGSQVRPASFSLLEQVARGVLGFNDEWNSGNIAAGPYNFCLGGINVALPDFGGGNCGYFWFTGIAASSSTELRTGGAAPTNFLGVFTEDSMVGAGSVHGSYTEFCGGLEYFGRSESPTVANTRGDVTCDGGTKTNRHLGLRGRGFQGTAIRPLTAPAAVDDLFAFPSYGLVPGSNAVDRGNQNVDWDPFTPGIQDPPATDLAGNPRIVGRRIDLGAFELQ